MPPSTPSEPSVSVEIPLVSKRGIFLSNALIPLVGAVLAAVLGFASYSQVTLARIEEQLVAINAKLVAVADHERRISGLEGLIQSEKTRQGMRDANIQRFYTGDFYPLRDRVERLEGLLLEATKPSR